jgi:hypothetical protein
MGSIMNSRSFTTLMDVSPISAHEAAKYMENMDVAADNIMTTN